MPSGARRGTPGVRPLPNDEFMTRVRLSQRFSRIAILVAKVLPVAAFLLTLRSGPKFEVLAENQLWDPAAQKPDPAKAAAEDTEEKRKAAAMFSGSTQYGVAAVSGSLLIRTGEKVYCLRTLTK